MEQSAQPQPDETMNASPAVPEPPADELEELEVDDLNAAMIKGGTRCG